MENIKKEGGEKSEDTQSNSEDKSDSKLLKSTTSEKKSTPRTDDQSKSAEKSEKADSKLTKSKSSEKLRQNSNSTPGIQTEEDSKADSQSASAMQFERLKSPESLDNRPLHEKMRDMRFLSEVENPQEKTLYDGEILSILFNERIGGTRSGKYIRSLITTAEPHISGHSKDLKTSKIFQDRLIYLQSLLKLDSEMELKTSDHYLPMDEEMGILQQRRLEMRENSGLATQRENWETAVQRGYVFWIDLVNAQHKEFNAARARKDQAKKLAAKEQKKLEEIEESN